MDKFPCSLCKKDCFPYQATHLDEHNKPVEPRVIHEQKFCRECLINNYKEKKGCPVCNAEYECPFNYEIEERPADKVAKLFSAMDAEPTEKSNEGDVEPTPMDEEKSNKANPIEIPDGDDKDPNYTPDEVYNVPPKRKFVEDKNDNIELPAELPEKSPRSNKKTSPNAPRGNKKAAAETKIQQLAKEIPIPEVHCAFLFGKTSEKHPHGLCLEVDDLEKSYNNKLYCPLHFYDGPEVETDLKTSKINAAKEKSLKNALARVEKQNEDAALDLHKQAKRSFLEDYKNKMKSSTKIISKLGDTIVNICQQEALKKSPDEDDKDDSDDLTGSNGSTAGASSLVNKLFSYLTKR